MARRPWRGDLIPVLDSFERLAAGAAAANDYDEAACGCGDQAFLESVAVQEIEDKLGGHRPCGPCGKRPATDDGNGWRLSRASSAVRPSRFRVAPQAHAEDQAVGERRQGHGHTQRGRRRAPARRVVRRGDEVEHVNVPIGSSGPWVPLREQATRPL